MSRNAIAAMAVIFVSGFAGCAATARAEERATMEAPTTAAASPHSGVALFNSVAAGALIASALYIGAATRRALQKTPRR
jgi:hypothetical protein